MSETDQKRVKKVNFTKLEKLSDEDLKRRIQEKEVRINEKRAYYEKMHSLNLARLDSFASYCDKDSSACKDILERRSKGQSVGEKKE